MNLIVKWLGHASFQIKAQGKIVYIDLYQTKPSEKADIILVTHSHYDHCDPSTINGASKTGTVVIAPEDCASKIGGKVKPLKAGQEIAMDDIKVKAVEAYNVKRFRSPGNPFHPKGSGVGYLISIGNKIVYHAGDTDVIPEMKKLGHVDLALLPSGSTYTMDNADAAEAALAINPDYVIPMHRWDTEPKEFKQIVEKANPKIKVVVLAKGEEFQVV